MIKLNDRLRELRKNSGASQEALASLVGVTTRGYRYYESGEREPTVSALIALADYFDVSLDYLTGRSDQP